METRIINTDEEKKQIEVLRAEVYGFSEIRSFHINELKNNKEHAIVTFDNGEMVAGCYFHRFGTILMIDEVFVKKEYQNTGLKLGRNLILKLIDNKKEIEELLGGAIRSCRLESRTSKAHELYAKIGFHEGIHNEDNMYKIL